MKRLCHANDRFEARLISDALTLHGIFSRIKFDEQAYPSAATRFGEGLEVHVYEQDWERALEVLSEPMAKNRRH